MDSGVVRQADDEYGGAPPQGTCPRSVTTRRDDQILMLIVEHCRKSICHRLAPLLPYRHRSNGVTWTDVTAAVLEGQTLEALGQEGLSLHQEGLPGLDVAEPSVEVELNGDTTVTVSVGELLNVL